jgi:hypothetical protein
MSLTRAQSAPPISLPAPTLRRTPAGSWRLASVIGGHEAVFESETRLYEGPESFLSAFLLPAMALGRDLESAAPVCREWLHNIEGARKLAARWWDFCGGSVHAPQHVATATAGEAGLFFSGGVDAFHTLIASGRRLDKLIFIVGADTHLRDQRRRQQDRHLLESAASRKGLELIIVATNLRQHPLFRRIGWWDSHGGALAGVAHALTGSIGSAVVSGSVSMLPHGSHPDLIPAYSSGRLRMQTHASGMPRAEKLRLLLSDPVAMGHLRVCWEHKDADGAMNCGACEKCLRTLLEIEAIRPGASMELPTFPPGTLPERLARLRRIPRHLAPLWRSIAEGQTSPTIRAQIDALVRRAERGWRIDRPLPRGLTELYRRLRAGWQLRGR